MVLAPVIGCVCVAAFAVVVRVTHKAALGSLSIVAAGIPCWWR